MDDEDLKYWLAIDKTQIIGPKRMPILLEYFKEVKNIWEAPEQELLRVGLNRTTAKLFLEKKRTICPDKLLPILEKLKVKPITLNNPDYPILLKHIPDPPIVIYIRGNTNLNVEGVGIVGTRKATNYGHSIAFEFAREISKYGISINSGLAIGIDSYSHKGALDSKGRTIAVLGSSIDRIYPAVNFQIAQKILGHEGSIISEYPPGTPGGKYQFVGRNRIIAGLSKGVLVVEAPEKSGALITADFALEQGREVYAIPGDILNKNSIGPNNLIKNGAKIVTKALDILEDFDIKENEKASINLSELEERILECLNEPKGINEIVKELSLNVTDIGSQMTLMELDGLVTNRGGSMYSKNI
ncbi:TPA: DNA-protecting protein DprA [candidate division CPR2 bacterium]|uniref:Protecting protein DprA, DNA processing protein n=1 Tax=candidate division CPR2 bacterium GW2011_GWC1_41_48 TaxID=1618344 RepID=A0A0G0WA43_UNCC2|nr:MAG: protecting protein DprA protein [candidate division CPR2 bacterium GW2011_GWC2_39_35]KKR28403.1 MAG: protecting protein DprA protein [candidate division CPR2 bacterium GW2011_GWD2_39_7]KKR28408.1 MAG: protecting protein DprA protein [candidate division CPR2 bacterium GW2011_GWD1_39_7]KKS09845.1 MAG: protecting protein DprA, DNA processing protein [candidate division CPR2 bacterium GW2011_GWC1_41_48]OGB60668.1 MAG: DNA protecting protein DprA [candidate division CPR2 bacterium GWD1_39_7]